MNTSYAYLVTQPTIDGGVTHEALHALYAETLRISGGFISSHEQYKWRHIVDDIATLLRLWANALPYGRDAQIVQGLLLASGVFVRVMCYDYIAQEDVVKLVARLHAIPALTV